MRTKPGWHGYWLNPGDAGLPMSVEWQLPPGCRCGPLRYPVPTRLTIAGLMNYVYERDYAVLVRLKVPGGRSGRDPDPRRGALARLHRQGLRARSGDDRARPAGRHRAAEPSARGSTSGAGRLPRPLAHPAKLRACAATVAASRSRCRASVTLGEPYVFPARPTARSTMPRRRRSAATATCWSPSSSESAASQPNSPACWRWATGAASSSGARRAIVPDGGTPVGALGANAVLLAVLGALLGGILLNLMPCVFPILALKALHLARAGGDEGEARRDALAYAAGAIVGTGALGALLLAIRAGGSAAGWAFQLQDPRMILLLLLLATAITLNLLGLFELPVLRRAGAARRAASATGALAAFVATPCAGPFLGAALGTALLLPPAGRLLVFAALGLGLALPFLRSPSCRRCATGCPSPARGWRGCQRFLAVPMAATAVGLPVAAVAAGGGRRRCWSGSSRSAGPGACAGRRGPAAARASNRGYWAGDRRSRRRRACGRRRCRSASAISDRAPTAPSRGAKRQSRTSCARVSRYSSISPPTGA